jgi:hypothetical protein
MSSAAASVANQAASAGRSANAVSTDASGIGATSSRISRELQTLLTYLTTTPASQIDSGYIASQATYLTRQLTALQDAGGAVDRSVMTLKATLRKLARSAAALR